MLLVDANPAARTALGKDKTSTSGGKVENRKQAIDARTQIATTTKALLSCGIASTKITHGGRHAGTSEAYHLGLDFDHIRHLGRWVMGQMENFYAPKNPTVGAFYMAHFNKRDEPYQIERDLVTPDLELQRLIFPWIEDVMDEADGKPWVEVCADEMRGINPTEATLKDVFWKPLALDKLSKTTASLTSSALIDRIAFLKLLVRMRRVILQDAVMMLTYTDPTGETLNNRLLSSDELKHIFSGPLFRKFQADLLAVIALHQEQVKIVNGSVQLTTQRVVSALNTLGTVVMNSTAQMQTQLHLNQDLAAETREEIKGLKKTFTEKFVQQEERQNQQDEWQLQHWLHLRHSVPPPAAVKQPYVVNGDISQPQLFTLHQHPRQLPPPLQQRRTQQHQLPPQPNSSISSLSVPSPSPRPPLPPPLTQNLTHAPLNSSDPSTKGYLMLPDNKSLTLRVLWTEYHGPIAEAKKNDPAYPYTQARKKALQRRSQVVDAIEAMAGKDEVPVESVIATLGVTYKDKTINFVREDLKKKKKFL